MSECPFCEGGGLAEDGEQSCSACGGSGRWERAAAKVGREAYEFFRKSEYKDSAYVADLKAVFAL